MKKITYLILLVLITWACTKEYMAPGPDPSHGVLVTSEMDFGNRVQVNGKMTFGDVSAGIESRKWIFPAEVDILDSDIDTESEEPVVKVVFRKSGEYEVKLNRTFKESPIVNGKAASKQSDTTIVVTVIDSVRASFTAQKLNNDLLPIGQLVLQDLAENEVEAGKFLDLTPVLSGEPETVTWYFEGGTPSTLSSFDPARVKYKKLGVYDVKLIASRNRPRGGDTLVYKGLIKVIPSKDPVTLDAISNVEDNEAQIELNYSRDLDPASLNASDFSVTVVNDGNSIPVSVSSIKLKDLEENIVVLNLSGGIYNNDSVSISYKGSLKTSDGIAATSFENRELEFKKNNLLVASKFDESFETSESENWPYQGWGGIYAEFDFDITSEESHTGGRSALIEYKPNGGMIIGHTIGGQAARFNAEAGKTYEIGFWIKVKSIGENKAGTSAPDIRFFWEPNTNWGVGGVELNENTPIDKWVYYTAPMAEFNSDGSYQFWIRGYNENNPESVIFYLDDISISEVKLRK